MFKAIRWFLDTPAIGAQNEEQKQEIIDEGYREITRIPAEHPDYEGVMDLIAYARLED